MSGVKGYCRWCGHCIDNGYNDYYCTNHDKFITTATAKSYCCKDFGDCGIDVITGKKFHTRTPKRDDGEQTRLWIEVT